LAFLLMMSKRVESADPDVAEQQRVGILLLFEVAINLCEIERLRHDKSTAYLWGGPAYSLQSILQAAAFQCSGIAEEFRFETSRRLFHVALPRDA
jgi:hypothetical protein